MELGGWTGPRTVANAAALFRPRRPCPLGEIMTNKTTAVVLFLIFIAVANCWWLPQKWQACQKLYDNQIAQVICLSSK
jgi:hypothetical protein